MLVEVLKDNYVIVLAEDNRDVQWLNKAGYTKLGEDYYQETFNNLEELILEVNYLLDNNATFDDRNDEEAPFKFLSELKAEGLVK
ncbi:MAG: hypothetical protein GX769_00410 [Erysipelothrix sp.]|nr:hypothetical protein [Erysipelothrix sp.]